MRVANIHASCVVLRGAGTAFGAPEDAGVLILGATGSGKSDLALRLIERGAALVADDRVELFVRDEQLWCRAPPNLTGLLEVRGVGIVSLSAFSEVAVALAVEAVAPDAVTRLPQTEQFCPPRQLALAPHLRPTLIRIVSTEASAPAKAMVAAAAAAHALFRDGRKP
ncbi:MAG: serine kinase [Rhizomicrobium sp.]|jgi:serine kinase of HPr protein (carbohydrate metabolism regulator)